MRQWCYVPGMLVMVSWLVGCGGGDQFDVSKVTGIVLCEGQPVPGAEVYFEPLQDGQSAIVGKQGFAFTGEDGRFALSTYGNGDGAVVAKHRVRVGGNPKSCDCVLNSEIDVMQYEVQAKEKNDVQVNLKKKTGKERPVLGYEEENED